MSPQFNWICCQLGAREHYAIPRALNQSGLLHTLITDAWVSPQSWINKIPLGAFRNLGDRHHKDLSEAAVSSFTPQLIGFELKHRLKKTNDWQRMIARNDWYQKQIISQLKKQAKDLDPSKTILFTYSYAARKILEYAKSQGWQTVLGQIDPGIEEEKIVLEEFKKHPELAPDWRPVPPEYWQSWQQECQLTDHILVNSEWSKKLLVKAGIIEKKIKIIPLVYQAPESAKTFKRSYPKNFTGDRPLRVLFLGLVTLRKGIAPYLQAIEQLKGQPIEFWFVGSQQIHIPESLRHHPQIKWVGSVPRSETSKYYQEADVFLFPSLSDGFGLTQLEAQAWKLPVIASKHCGNVVRNNIDGIILEQVNGEEIRRSLLALKKRPQKLQQFAEEIQQNLQFSIESFGQSIHFLNNI